MPTISPLLRSSLPYTVSMVALFVLGTIAGYMLDPSYFATMLDSLKTFIEEIEQTTKGNDLYLMLYIFANNAGKALLFMLITSIIPFAAVVFVFSNALMLGALGRYMELEKGVDLTTMAAGILPHGILELGMIFLASGIGVYMFSQHWQYIVQKKKTINLRGQRLSVFHTAVCIIIPLLFLAAVVETYVTPMVMGKFM